LRQRYHGRDKTGRGLLVDEACALCGYSRKHALKVLNGRLPIGGQAPVARRGGRRPRYGEAHRQVLKSIWLTAEQPCGKRLVGALALWVPAYEREYGRLARALRREVLAMSAASLDRVLKPCRVAAGARRRCGTKPGSLLKQQVAVRCGPWDVDGAGWVEGDTVAHGGGSTDGDFVWTVTLTDIHTQWTVSFGGNHTPPPTPNEVKQTRAVWNKGADGVKAAIADIETKLPFKLLGFDSDNGGEFLNWHLHAYFKERPEVVNFTRSREYKKNDNAHVERKSWGHYTPHPIASRRRRQRTGRMCGSWWVMTGWGSRRRRRCSTNSTPKVGTTFATSSARS
jgi:hypothetical protein